MLKDVKKYQNCLNIFQNVERYSTNRSNDIHNMYKDNIISKCRKIFPIFFNDILKRRKIFPKYSKIPKDIQKS